MSGRRALSKAATLPELRDVASDQQNGGLKATLVIDRDTASRLGITPQTIDDTLYDAFGQRQVSTIFTQLNQYHVVLEVEPQFQQNPRFAARTFTSSPPAGTRCRSQPSRHFETHTRRSRSITRDSFRW